jgi:hypothetical protein
LIRNAIKVFLEEKKVKGKEDINSKYRDRTSGIAVGLMSLDDDDGGGVLTINKVSRIQNL